MSRASVDGPVFAHAVRVRAGGMVDAAGNRLVVVAAETARKTRLVSITLTPDKARQMARDLDALADKCEALPEPAPGQRVAMRMEVE